MDQSPKPPIIPALGFLVACLGIGFIGAEGALQGLGGWYMVIEKPGWSPPVWLFVPLWTFAYWCAAGAGLLARRTEGGSIGVFELFWLLLLINSVWAWLFFAKGLPLAALVVIAFAWAIGLAVTALFFRRHVPAGSLMVLFLIWIAYSAALNYEVFRLNPRQPRNGAPTAQVRQPELRLRWKPQEPVAI